MASALLFFDTETAGLPTDWNAPAASVEKWPRLVQIGWIRCFEDGQVEESAEYVIRPEGFTISPQAARIHGITTAAARRIGVPVAPVLERFASAVDAASAIVAHNFDFDEKIVQAEWIRAGQESFFPGNRTVCTMKSSASFCRLPGRRGYKWPTLAELHHHLFGRDFEGAHGARADAEACMRCYFRLRELGVLR